MWKRSILAAAVLAVGGVSALTSCASRNQEAPARAKVDVSSSARKAVAGPTMATTRPTDLPGLHNVVAFGDGFYSGGVPEGDEAFETLAAMGIRTILSVDGAAPDVERARAHDMRYVHLPISYGGISRERTLELARAVRDLPGPIYIHCHHGKHRSASATGVAAVTLGKLTPAEAVARMKVSGTAPNYTGLYECVNLATVASDADLMAASDAFPEVWKTSGMVQAMVEIDEVNDLLKLIEKAGWAVPADHPDLVPAAEAGRLADLMRVLIDDHETKDRPAEFAAWLKESSDLATKLENDLVAGGVAPQELSKTFAGIAKSCKTCHTAYRD